VGVEHQSLNPNQLIQEISNSSVMGAHPGNSCNKAQLQVLWGL